jgi:hypothetical protein
MDEQLHDLLERCAAAHEKGISLLDRYLQLIATRRRLRHHGVRVLEEFALVARDFYDSVASRRGR